jgi:hypothetical protein
VITTFTEASRLGVRVEMPEIHKNKTLAALRNDSRELKIANRRIKELEDNCEEERKRGDRYQRDASEFKKGLKEIDSIILQQSETLRPLRPDFFRTVRQIHRSLEDGPRGPKLVTTLLQEFDCDLNASVYLDGLQVDLDTWAKEYWPGERGAVYNEISAKIKNHRLGKSNEVQKLREQIAGLENSLENKCEETRQRQEIENDLRLKMQQLKEGHYQTTAQLRQEHEGLKTRHTEEVTKIKRDHENKLARLNGEIPTREKIHKDKIERLWNEHNRAIARLEAKHTEAETSAQGIYVQETTRLNKTINQLTQELNQQKGLLQKKVSELQESHDSKIQLQGRNHKTKEEGLLRQLSEAKRNHEREVEELKLKHESSLQAERNTHSATIEKMKQGHEEEKSIWQTDLAKEKEKHASEKLRLNAEYNQRREKIKEEHKSQLGKLTAKLDKIEDKHAAELHKLRGSFEHEIEAYCAALLARDKFTPLPDSDISVMFMALKQDVDALSLLEWKADRKKWPNKVLRQLSDNQRSLKQQMLQNIIWRSLYEYIFCSPFRVLGEEGRLLEKQWNDEYSQGLFHAFLGQLILSDVR